MSSTTSPFGQLLQAYLFFVGMTETQLAGEIGLSLNKVSAAIHGKYRLKRDHVDRIVAELTKRGVNWTEADRAEFLAMWRSGTIDQWFRRRIPRAFHTVVRILHEYLSPEVLALSPQSPCRFAAKGPVGAAMNGFTR